MASREKRRSDRLVPVMWEEDFAFVEYRNHDIPAKLIDFNTHGALVCLIDLLTDWQCFAVVGESCNVLLHHEGSAFNVKAKVVRRTGRLLAFKFLKQTPEVAEKLQRKFDRLAAAYLALGERSRQIAGATSTH